MLVNVIIVAAGKGLRLKSQIPKQFLPLSGKPILAHTLAIFEQHPAVEEIVIVGAQDWLFYLSSDIVEKYRFDKVRKIVAGGKERQHSVQAGLEALENKKRPVLIHDGVRPFVSAVLIDRVLASLQGADACIPAIASADTIKEVDGDWVRRTLPRASLRRVQTPQVFHTETLLDALSAANRNGDFVTDEATLIEKKGGKVRWVEGEIQNMKITTDFDLKVAHLILGE